jgi:hypothetical protein
VQACRRRRRRAWYTSLDDGTRKDDACVRTTRSRWLTGLLRWRASCLRRATHHFNLIYQQRAGARFFPACLFNIACQLSLFFWPHAAARVLCQYLLLPSGPLFCTMKSLPWAGTPRVGWVSRTHLAALRTTTLPLPTLLPLHFFSLLLHLALPAALLYTLAMTHHCSATTLLCGR